MQKICEWCGNAFETTDTVHGRRKRFCNTSCSAKWRNKTFGPNSMSEEAKRKNADILHKRWQDPEFRKKKIEYMRTNNPVYIPGVVEKIKSTTLKNGGYKNYFRYGNGKISPHEQLVYDFLLSHGFYYNYAISTKLARDAFPEKHYPPNYKPDFVNVRKKICIEIDGNNHKKAEQIKLDEKKDECLHFLGFTIFRFTHEQVENKKVEEFINGKTTE